MTDGPTLRAADDPLHLVVERSRPRWPAVTGMIVAALSLVLVALFAARSIERRERAEIADRLERDVAATLEVLDVWASNQRRTAASWAADPGVVEQTKALLALGSPTPAALAVDPAQIAVREILTAPMDLHGYRGFFIVSPDGTSLASSRDTNLGTPNLVALEEADRFAVALGGATTLTIPQVSDVPLSEVDRDELTMFTAAPIIDDGRVIAVFLFRIDVPGEFRPLLDLQERGATDEMLAFDHEGALLAPSRFQATLAAERGVDPEAFWTVRLTEPGDGELTEMAARALAGGSGVDVDGYRNHLGTEVYGAWAWSEQLGFGLASEAAADELLADWRYARTVIVLLTSAALAVVAGLGWYLAFVRPALEERSDLEAERARRFRTLLDQSSDGIAVIAADHRIVLANQAMSTLFRIPPERLVGLEIHSLVDPGRRSAHAGMVAGFFAGGHPGGRMAPQVRSVQATRADGSQFATEITLSRVDLDDGEEVVLASVRDLTTDLRAIALDQALRELERLTAVVAHDLREPLRKLGSLSGLLTSPDADAERTLATAARIEEAASRAWSLSDDLATYIDWSTRPLVHETVDLGAVVAEVVASFEAVLSAADGEVTVGELPLFEGDRSQLRRLFTELIENALRFRAGPPRIRVRADRPPAGETMTITVQDNGIGAPTDQLDRAFEAFRSFAPLQRAADLPGGNGIGLAICRRIVERHGGAIELEAADDGTRVSIRLPARRSSPIEPDDIIARRPPEDVTSHRSVRS